MEDAWSQEILVRILKGAPSDENDKENALELMKEGMCGAHSLIEVRVFDWKIDANSPAFPSLFRYRIFRIGTRLHACDAHTKAN